MTREIVLTRGMVALVDDADFDWLNQWKWCALKTGSGFYAYRIETKDGVQKGVLMHRQITSARRDDKVDHRNRETLDNQRVNLRPCTPAQNSLNRCANKTSKTSLFKGVYWQKDIKRWRAKFQARYLGTFIHEDDAARAYDLAAYAGSPAFALLNFQK
jgi:hypothetical protein